MTVPTGETTVRDLELTAVRDLELTAQDDDTLAADFDDAPACYDSATGKVVLDVGAYSDVGAYTDLVPIWVVDGKVQIFLGRYQSTATPTDGETWPSRRVRPRSPSRAG